MERRPAQACPFCGVTTDVPHETQEGCIEALQHEIARMRGILEHVRAPGSDLHQKDDRELA
jgi:hypothetical protein